MRKKVADIEWQRGHNNHIGKNVANIENTKQLLNTTGCGFCLAKFTQVTMHLGTGLTHACHHPSPHKIPLEEIEKNPAALFNTSVLKKARREMLEGQRPSECDYCWRIEDNGSPSDRFFKSLEPWALDNHDAIQESNPDQDYFPTYLEVDFSNACNFKCVYCGPEFSSKWVEELKQNGPVKLLEDTKHVTWANGWQDLDELTYRNNEFNPYIDAFWKWWPEAYKHLSVYRITGGEPLLSKETFRSMDWLIENPNPNLEFNINTNMGVPDKLWDLFIERVKQITSSNCIKKLTIFTSVDGWGERAEYLRPGLNFEVWKKRYEQLIALGNVRVIIMCTFNILSISSIQQLLEWQYDLKKQYNPHDQGARWEEETGFRFSPTGDTYLERKRKNPNHFATVGIDMPYLRSPSFLDAKYIDDETIQKYLIPAINYMGDNTATHSWNSHQAFEDYELEKFKRVCLDIMGQSKRNRDHGLSDETIVNRAKFYDFVNDLDRRYKTKFTDVFPELANFYEHCKDMKQKVVNKDV